MALPVEHLLKAWRAEKRAISYADEPYIQHAAFHPVEVASRAAMIERTVPW